MEIGLIFVGFACLLLLMYAARRYRDKQRELNEPHLATVIGTVQTGRQEGSLTEADIEVEIAGRTPRRAKLRQWIEPKHLPRPGRVVRVLKQDGALVLVGSLGEASSADTDPLQGGTVRPGAETRPPEPASAPQQDSPAPAIMASALTAELRQQGRLEIATIAGARTLGSGLSRFTLQVDAIHGPPRTVELDQLLSHDTFSTGERAYLLVSSQDGNEMHLLSPAEVGGQRLPREMNRLDPYVLGPKLLRHGARARGTVLRSKQVPLSPEHEVRGFTRFQLTFRIEPEATTPPPYEAEQTITLTRPEKIAVMAKPGCVIPLRIDTAKPETFTTDSIAMGYGDPYAEALNLFREQLSNAGGAR